MASVGIALIAIPIAPVVAGTPAVSLSASSLDFGSTGWMQAAPTQTLVVTNTGDAPLAISAVDISGQPYVPADFIVFLDQCPSSFRTLAPGESCQESIRFTPQSGGPRTATMTIFDNAPGSPQQVRLTGTGAGAVVMFSPRSLDFGLVSAGTTSAPLTFSAVDAGDGPVTISTVSLGPAPWWSTWFAITADACSGATLVPGQRCAVSLNVTPTSVGSGSQSIAFTDNVGTGRQTYDQVAAAGDGPQAGVLEIPRFSQGVGTSSAATTLQVYDSGTQPVQVSGVSLDDPAAGFSIAHDGCSGTTIALNTPFNFPPPLCNVDVVFTPPAVGSYGANLVIHDNELGGVHKFPITGAGYAPVGVLSTTAIDFGFQVVGATPASQVVTLSNPSPQPLSVYAVTLSGDSGFSLTSDACTGATVAPGGACAVNVAFTPLFPYLFNATLTFRDNAPALQPAISLRGEGQSPTFSISTNHLDFGNQHTNLASGPLTLTVTNTSQQALTFSFLTGYYAMPWTGCSAPVAPQASCTVSLTVTPGAVGAQTALFKVVDPASNQQVVEVRWTGTTGEGRIEGDSLTNIAQQTGTTVSRTAVVINGGSDVLNIGQVSLSNASPASITADSCSGKAIAVHKNCTITLTVHPTVSGSWYTTLTVPTDASLGPNPVTSYVSGTVGTPQPQPVFVPSFYTFAAQRVGGPETTHIVWLEDGLVATAGAPSVAIASVAIGGADASSFRVVWDGCGGLLIDPAYSCPVAVGFNPTKGGPLSAALLFSDDAGASPQTVPLGGLGLAPAVSLSPTSIDFGNVLLRSKSQAATVRLTNSGNFALKIGRETITGSDKGDFTITAENCQNQSLAAGASCQMTIVFRPSATGVRVATLTFTDTAPDSPQSVGLAGSGVNR